METNAQIALTIIFIVGVFGLSACWDYEHPCALVKPCLQWETISTLTTDGKLGVGEVCIKRGSPRARDPKRCDNGRSW